MRSHGAAQMEANSLPSGSAQISQSAQVRAEVNPAAAWRGLHLDKQHVIAALRMQFPPALPIRQNVKFSAKIKRPRIENPGDRRDENQPEHRDYGHLPKASETSQVRLLLRRTFCQSVLR